jgi:MOSC domain-containing protein YiiM
MVTTMGTGTVEGIFSTEAAGQPMRALTEALAIADHGLVGDRYHDDRGFYSERPMPDGGRQLTLVEAEVLESLAAEHGIELTPVESRRNVVTRGVQLHDLIGKRFQIGPLLCEGTRVCEPCVRLEELTGKPVNEPLVHRGGLRVRILEGGTLRIGDSVRLAEVDERAAAATASPAVGR